MRTTRRKALHLGGLGLVALSVSARAQTAKPFRVVTTFTIIQDIAQNVAGSAAVVESVTKPGAEIHEYQPTPLDIVRAQSADLVLWNGDPLDVANVAERVWLDGRAIPMRSRQTDLRDRYLRGAAELPRAYPNDAR